MLVHTDTLKTTEESKMEWQEQGMADFWKPEDAEDELEGEIVGINTTEDFGTQYSVKTPEGKISTTPSHAVLMAKMKAVKVGDFVRIVYQGEKANDKKGRNPIKLYRVYVAKN